MKYLSPNNPAQLMESLKVILISAFCTVALMLSWFAGIALAADTNQTPTGLPAVIQSVTGKKNLKWEEIFKNKETFGQNMYFKIYEQTQINPEEKALKASAEKLGITPSQVKEIMNGSIGPILTKNPRISVDQALVEMDRMRNVHLEQLVTDVVENDLKAIAEPSEMFSNGDTSDSGFDLIVDLNRIEKILFDTSTPVDVGGNQLDLGSGLPGREPLNKDDQTTGGQNDNSGSNNSGLSGGDKSSSNSTEDDIKTAAAPAPVDPNICLVDPELEKGLKTLGEDSQTDPRLRDRSGTTGSDSGNGNGGDAGAGTSGTDNGSESGDSDDAVEAPKTGDWSVPQICDGVLCFTVEAKMKKAEVAPPKADCVACHVTAMNKTMKELLSKSLLPSKLTGNAMEPGKCKQAAVTSFTSVNMNVVLIPKPVPAPSHDDLVVGKSVVDEWNKFTSRYAGTGKVTDKQAAANLKRIPKSLTDKVTDKTIEDSSLTSSLGEVYEKIDKTLTSIEAQRNKDLADLQTAGDVNNASAHYQALRYQLDTMISYFNSYKKIFSDIQVPCKSLLSKKTCS